MSPATTPRQAVNPAVIVAGLTVLALILRAWRLGNWGFEGDEVFTLRDSVSQPRLDNPRPLLYFLNYYVVRPIVPLDELGLRLLPAIFGVLAIPAFYLVVRRLAGTRPALFSALLLTVSAVHVHQSQYARYWSLVFLLSAIYPFATYLGFRERNLRVLALGLLTGVLAVLAHPAAVLLVGGLGLWLLITNRRRAWRAELWNQWSIRWGAVLMLIVAGVIAVRYVPILRAWTIAHNGTIIPERLLRLPSGPGMTQIGVLLSYLEGLTLPVVLTGVLGIYVLWAQRDRPLALLLICLFLFHAGFIVLLSFGTAVGASYIMPTAPVFFIGAGVFLDRLAEVDWKMRPRWLPTATVAAIIIAAGLPTLISQYRDGRRNDFRAAARWLDQHLAAGDVVYSDQYQVLTHYLQKTQAEQLSVDPGPLMQSVRGLHNAGTGGALWIVAPHSSRGSHRTHPKLESLKRWIYGNCQLRTTVGVARLDFRQNELQIYRCPPAGPHDLTGPSDTSKQAQADKPSPASSF